LRLPGERHPIEKKNMSARKLIVAAALMSVAATAHAEFVSALSESTTVTLVFIGLATIGLVVSRKKKSQPADA